MSCSLCRGAVVLVKVLVEVADQVCHLFAQCSTNASTSDWASAFSLSLWKAKTNDALWPSKCDIHSLHCTQHALAVRESLKSPMKQSLGSWSCRSLQLLSKSSSVADGQEFCLIKIAILLTCTMRGKINFEPPSCTCLHTYGGTTIQWLIVQWGHRGDGP